MNNTIGDSLGFRKALYFSNHFKMSFPSRSLTMEEPGTESSISSRVPGRQVMFYSPNHCRSQYSLPESVGQIFTYGIPSHSVSRCPQIADANGKKGTSRANGQNNFSFRESDKINWPICGTIFLKRFSAP